MNWCFSHMFLEQKNCLLSWQSNRVAWYPSRAASKNRSFKIFINLSCFLFFIIQLFSSSLTPAQEKKKWERRQTFSYRILGEGEGGRGGGSQSIVTLQLRNRWRGWGGRRHVSPQPTNNNWPWHAGLGRREGNWRQVSKEKAPTTLWWAVRGLVISMRWKKGKEEEKSDKPRKCSSDLHKRD